MKFEKLVHRITLAFPESKGDPCSQHSFRCSLEGIFVSDFGSPAPFPRLKWLGCIGELHDSFKPEVVNKLEWMKKHAVLLHTFRKYYILVNDDGAGGSFLSLN